LQVRLEEVEYKQIRLCARLQAAQVRASQRIRAGERPRAHQLVRRADVRLAEVLLRQQARDAQFADDVHAVGIGADARAHARLRESRVREVLAFAREAERAVRDGRAGGGEG